MAEEEFDMDALDAALERILVQLPCDRRSVLHDPGWNPTPGELAREDQLVEAAFDALRRSAPEVGRYGDDQGL